ncbi:zinc protease [Paenibacillus swuensis]|uniref:Zinc protease n=1 Tax=Paenibacillus swuensis TaxID=1178515 RepID=A0A172TL08_9BACL|nr:pitrilysin family protein [Paenibacillus swuensis]ANE47594.1 zinc protease [Paenibacillus swuensis]
MEAITHDQLKETIYFEKLPNGLQVFVLPKEGFQKTYAAFSTRFGSIDNHFKVQGQEEQQVPDGIAHFLEHKMFEEPDGDVFAKFASNGASANAFTSFDRTVYLFSATESISENLETLINFVQNPYFTDDNVEKEKGIIGQEINMYKDNPDWRVYFGLIETMYRTHPVHIDIAGTVESIAQITKETLYDCYHTFYHPSNMSLFVVGGINAEEMMTLIRDNQASKSFEPQGPIDRIFAEEPNEVAQARKETILPVSLPKCLFGFKEAAPAVDGDELLRKELTMRLALDILFSPSAPLYQQLYDDNLISDGFGSEYNCSKDYAFSVIGGDTRSPEELMDRIRTELEPIVRNGVDEASFERSRRKKIGAFLRMMNSPEAIANEFTKFRFRNTDLFKVLPMYEAITLQEVNDSIKKHFDWNQFAASLVTSKVK